MGKSKTTSVEQTLTLFPAHQAELLFPAYWVEQIRIGGNPVFHLGYPEREIECELHDRGSACIVAKSAQGEQFYIALPQRKPPTGNGDSILRLKTPFSDIKQVGRESVLTWLQHPSANGPREPREIVASWKNSFLFREEGTNAADAGLRRPQLGAVHAIAAHLTVSADPATIVMPTGIGKTETMLSVLVYCQCQKAMVLVPSDALRAQIFGKFVTLGCLPDIGVLPNSICRPRVAMIKRGIRDSADAEKLVSAANVLVATPDVLESFSDDSIACMTSACTHLFIDEAHHVAAPTWRKIKERFQGKPILQFTATPFRRDGQSLEGSILYNYPLSSAQRDGYFKHIRLYQVEDYDDPPCDEAVATRAVKVLREDLSNKLDHLMMARVRSIDRAEQVLKHYKRICPELNPVVVHSKMNKSDRQSAMDAVRKRQSRVIVCVDMLGEGFDMPNLKVAALHDIHKSLAVTLQFIGRFTRTTPNVGDAAVIVDVTDPKVPQELQALYAENPDWDHILRLMSETTIERQVVHQKLVDSFKSCGNLASQISLWNLRPAFSATLFRTECDAWTPASYAGCLRSGSQHWYALSTSENVLVVVVAREEEVKWGKYREIKDSTFELLVAHWDPDRKALFIHCSDEDFFRCRLVAEAICGSSASPVTGPNVCRIFGSVQRPMVRNLGASKAGNISFTMYFGPNVTDGLDQIERKTSQLSNLYGWGYEEGKKVSWGCSERKGKIWSSGGGTVSDWKDWCLGAWSKVTNESINEPELIKGFLRPKWIASRPSVVPLYVQWGERLVVEQEDRVWVCLGDREHELYEVDLEVDSFSEVGPLTFAVRANDSTAIYELDISTAHASGYEYIHRSGPPVSIRKGRAQKRSLQDYLGGDPLIFSYVDGSFSYNNVFVKVSENASLFALSGLNPIDWMGTDIRKESQGKERRIDSIQYRVIETIKNDYEIIFDDDSSGEAADIIALRQQNGKIELRLIHCKFSSKDTKGARIDDMYVLCGQAQKCIRWKHNGFGYLVNHMRRRNVRWQNDGQHTRFVKGTMKDLNQFKRLARNADVVLNVDVVQPGLAKSQVSDDILRLLSGTELFLKKTANATFQVLCSG